MVHTTQQLPRLHTYLGMKSIRFAADVHKNDRFRIRRTIWSFTPLGLNTVLRGSNNMEWYCRAHPGLIVLQKAVILYFFLAEK